MRCPRCTIAVLPYLEKCDRCGARIQTAEEAQKERKFWDELPPDAQQEFQAEIAQDRVWDRIGRARRRRALFRYLIATGVIFAVLTFFSEYVVKSEFQQGMWNVSLGFLFGMAGYLLLYLLHGGQIKGVIIITASYVSLDLIKPGASYLTDIIPLISTPGPNFDFAVVCVLVFIPCLLVLAVSGFLLGGDIASRISE